TGKFQASVTLYDSDDFGRSGANPGHTYAIQPLIYKSVNSAGNTDFIDGLLPDIEIKESPLDLGILGDPSEPLLEAALNKIEGKQQKTKSGNTFSMEVVGESGMESFLYKKMYSFQNLPQLKKD